MFSKLSLQKTCRLWPLGYGARPAEAGGALSRARPAPAQPLPPTRSEGKGAANGSGFSVHFRDLGHNSLSVGQRRSSILKPCFFVRAENVTVSRIASLLFSGGGNRAVLAGAEGRAGQGVTGQKKRGKLASGLRRWLLAPVFPLHHLASNARGSSASRASPGPPGSPNRQMFLPALSPRVSGLRLL